MTKSNTDVAVRLANRLSDESNGLLSEEDLVEISKKAIEEAFFKPITTTTGSGYSTTTKYEPYIAKLVRDVISDRIETITRNVLLEWLKTPEANEKLLKIMDLAPEQLIRKSIVDMITSIVLGADADRHAKTRNEILESFRNVGISC